MARRSTERGAVLECSSEIGRGLVAVRCLDIGGLGPMSGQFVADNQIGRAGIVGAVVGLIAVEIEGAAVFVIDAQGQGSAVGGERQIRTEVVGHLLATIAVGFWRGLFPAFFAQRILNLFGKRSY